MSDNKQTLHHAPLKEGLLDKESGIVANNAVHGSDSYEAFVRDMAIIWS